MLGGLLVGQEGGQRGGLGEAEAIAHARVRERLHDPVHEALGDRRAAVGDPAHTAHVEVREGGVAHHGVVDRGHRDELVDAVLADGAEEALEVQWPGEDLHAPAELEHGDQLAVAAGHVKQRHGHQRRDVGALGTVDRQATERVLAVGEEVPVRGHRALREARRSARVEDRRKVLRAEIVDRDGLALRQRRRCGERELRAGVPHHVGDLLGREAGVDRNDGRAEHLRTEERQHPVDPVRHVNRHAITALDAEAAQPSGHGHRAMPQLAVAQRRPPDLEHGGRGRVAFNARPQHRHERGGKVAVACDTGGVALDARLLERITAAGQWLGHHSPALVSAVSFGPGAPARWASHERAWASSRSGG